MYLNMDPDQKTDFACISKIVLEYLVIMLIMFLFLISLPILPFVYISYKGFHGKYGIVRKIKDFVKKM